MTPDILTHYLKTLGALFGALTAFCSFFPWGRKFLFTAGMWLLAPFRTPWILIDLHKKSGETVEAIRTLRAEITFEGEGSVTQNVTRLMNQALHVHRIQQRPAMYLDQHGYLKSSSYALHALFKVSSESELLGANWHNWVDDAQIRFFLERFQMFTNTSSKIRSVLRLYDKDKTYLGEWTLHGTPIEPKINGNSLYVCNLTPNDEEAQSICTTRRWAI